MKRILVVMSMGTLAVALTAGPSLAQQDYPPAAADIALDDAAIDCPSGETLTITGSGFIPNEPAVGIFFDGDQIAEVFPNSQGEFSVTVDPPAAAAGQHTIEARQDGIVATATLTCVVAAPGAVAFTGANVTLWMVALVALVGIGAVALYAGRRRARTRV